MKEERVRLVRRMGRKGSKERSEERVKMDRGSELRQGRMGLVMMRQIKMGRIRVSRVRGD